MPPFYDAVEYRGRVDVHMIAPKAMVGGQRESFACETDEREENEIGCECHGEENRDWVGQGPFGAGKPKTLMHPGVWLSQAKGKSKEGGDPDGGVMIKPLFSRQSFSLVTPAFPLVLSLSATRLHPHYAPSPAT